MREPQRGDEMDMGVEGGWKKVGGGWKGVSILEGGMDEVGRRGCREGGMEIGGWRPFKRTNGSPTHASRVWESRVCGRLTLLC